MIERSATWSSPGDASDRDDRGSDPRGRDDRGDRQPSKNKKKGSFARELFENLGDFGG